MNHELLDQPLSLVRFELALTRTEEGFLVEAIVTNRLGFRATVHSDELKDRNVLLAPAGVPTAEKGGRVMRRAAKRGGWRGWKGRKGWKGWKE